jgi:hypothetical protein
MWAFWPIVLALAALAAGAVLLLGRTRRALWAALAVALAVLGAVWLVGWRLVESGWHDVDGFIDCRSCNGWHLTGALLLFGPPIVALVLVATAVVVELRRR